MGQADQAHTDALGASVPRPAMQIFAAFTHLGDTVTLIVLCLGIAFALVPLGRRWLAFGWVVKCLAPVMHISFVNLHERQSRQNLDW